MGKEPEHIRVLLQETKLRKPKFIQVPTCAISSRDLTKSEFWSFPSHRQDGIVNNPIPY